MSESSSVGHARRRLMTGAAARALLCAPMAVALGVAIGPLARAGTVNPVQMTTYNLSPANNPITFDATTDVDAAAAPGVVGRMGTAWNVTNYGFLQGSAGVYLSGFPSDVTVTNHGVMAGKYGFGLSIAGGGVVTNTAGAVILGNGVEPRSYGVVFRGSNGSVTNAGSITSVASVAIDFFSGGGTVDNQAGGKISGDFAGVYARTQPAAVTNAGAISGGGGFGVYLRAGGSLTNTASGTISGSLNGAIIENGPATVVNDGAIYGSNLALAIDSGSITNNAGGFILSGFEGVVTGLNGPAPASTITNAGRIIGTFSGVSMGAGGALTNVSGGYIAGGAGGTGVSLFGAGTITNAGAIGGAGQYGVLLGQGGTVINQAGGTIGGTLGGIVIRPFGNVAVVNTIYNQAGATITGGAFGAINLTISGTYGIETNTVTNAGMITGGNGVVMSGGNLTNLASGQIKVDGGGVLLMTASGDVTNAGVISGGIGVGAKAGATISNLSGGTITGQRYGVELYNYGTTPTRGQSPTPERSSAPNTLAFR